MLPTTEAAMPGVGTKIVGDPTAPTVSGTSGPTTLGTFDNYAAVPQEDGIHYGVGAVIFALVETSGMQ